MNTVDLKVLSTTELATLAANSMHAKGQADTALATIQQQQKEASAMLASVVRDCRRRKLVFPKRVNPSTKGEGASFLRTMREVFVDMGLAPGTISNYLTGIREAVDGKRAPEAVKENKARDKAPAAKKGADEKSVTFPYSVAIGKGTDPSQFAAYLLGELKKQKGLDWGTLAAHVENALAELTDK